MRRLLVNPSSSGCDARRFRVWASFSLRSDAHVQRYAPLRSSQKPRPNPNLAGGCCDGTRASSPPSALEDAKQLLDRIVEAIGHALFERDDRVVSDGDALGAHLGATLGDVAVADALLLFQVRQAIFGVERVHLECR